MGISHKSAETKAKEMLQDFAQHDVNELKASVDNLEEEWKKSNGAVSRVPGARAILLL